MKKTRLQGVWLVPLLAILLISSPDHRSGLVDAPTLEAQILPVAEPWDVPDNVNDPRIGWYLPLEEVPGNPSAAKPEVLRVVSADRDGHELTVQAVQAVKDQYQTYRLSFVLQVPPECVDLSSLQEGGTFRFVPNSDTARHAYAVLANGQNYPESSDWFWLDRASIEDIEPH